MSYARDSDTNLLQETLEILEANKKDPCFVLWVGSSDGDLSISWDEFALIAQDVDYYAGFGGEEIALDLVVVGSNWWLERHTYDGSECWLFKSIPFERHARPFNRVEIECPDGGRRYNLKEINDPRDE